MGKMAVIIRCSKCLGGSPVLRSLHGTMRVSQTNHGLPKWPHHYHQSALWPWWKGQQLHSAATQMLRRDLRWLHLSLPVAHPACMPALQTGRLRRDPRRVRERRAADPLLPTQVSTQKLALAKLNAASVAAVVFHWWMRVVEYAGWKNRRKPG